MKKLTSYVRDTWVPAQDNARNILNPTTEEAVASVHGGGFESSEVLAFARERGGAELRAMTFAQRAALLRAMSKAIVDAREELIELAIRNGGNTRKDAKFDIDGASFTLAAYADLGMNLGDTRLLADGDPIQVGRTARLSGQHILSPRRGVAVHINAFNFPAWGLAEKAAAALLAGMPVITKPATATALVAHRVMELFVEQELLPSGVLSFVAGGVGDLLDHLGGQDVLAFTGSGNTAEVLRGLRSIISNSVAVNVEADSLNSATLAPDVSLSDEAGQLFLRDVVTDMTQKTGQKCTAIRRVIVPGDRMDEVAEALSERLDGLVVGNPANAEVRMGPLASAQQLEDVKSGIAALESCTSPVFGGSGEVKAVGVPDGRGFFVGPVLRRAASVSDAPAMHAREVFGPVATLAPYSGDATDAARIVRMGAGGLVASLYSNDRDFIGTMVEETAAHHGRLYLGSDKVASQSPGPGTVIPHLLHGGPGRAGGGEELGGLRGLKFYQQRTALQGDKSIIGALLK
jgi:oxepin-CoA hydrolase/3-oxo-5,6-dehydrosuberyl-CoA semialdehyde dehydrogenase